jgi:hypothetical protein
MQNDEWEQCYQSLLSCMIGLISTADLHHIRDTIKEYPNKDLEEYYKKSLEDHAKMTIYKNDYIN